MQRTWIYSLPNKLNASQESALSTDINNFIQNWKSHGTPVRGEYQLRYGQFLLVQADEMGEKPSGCSIDSMKHAVEAALQRISVKPADAAQVFYKNTAGEVAFLHFKEIGAALQAGHLSPETLVLDHTLSQTDDLNLWEVPLKDTWLKRFL